LSESAEKVCWATAMPPVSLHSEHFWRLDDELRTVARVQGPVQG
jgi:hypothetical protein